MEIEMPWKPIKRVNNEMNSEKSKCDADAPVCKSVAFRLN